MRSLELKIPPLVLGLVLGTLMWVVARKVPTLRFTAPAGPIVASLLAATGVTVAILGIVSFRRARTTVNPLQPETATALVVSGIFRLTRNPMYLGLLLVLAGWALFLANALTFAFPLAYVPLMNRLQIIPEEKALAARFGGSFAAYQSRCAAGFDGPEELFIGRRRLSVKAPTS
jgi:protein-S-isoprenylcysteine O-methyltransferase Ste14